MKINFSNKDIHDTFGIDPLSITRNDEKFQLEMPSGYIARVRLLSLFPMVICDVDDVKKSFRSDIVLFGVIHV